MIDDDDDAVGSPRNQEAIDSPVDEANEIRGCRYSGLIYSRTKVDEKR
jgi:hypothetical protein